MNLAAAIARNGSAQISGASRQHTNNRVPLKVNVRYIIAEKVFNPSNRYSDTGVYVAPGKYKVILESVTPVPGIKAGERDFVGWSSDLTKCERFVQGELLDYDPDGWQPSSGEIIDSNVNPYADWSGERFF